MRQTVRFDVVPDHQHKIDARLCNWAAWARDRVYGRVHPMFQAYRPDNYEREPRRMVDIMDAQAVQKGVSKLPTAHAISLNWHYVKPTSPSTAARKLGRSIEGLNQLVIDARQMLINRGV